MNGGVQPVLMASLLKSFFSVKVASILPATPLPFKRAMTLVPVFPLNYPTNGGGEWHLITLLQI